MWILSCQDTPVTGQGDPAQPDTAACELLAVFGGCWLLLHELDQNLVYQLNLCVERFLRRNGCFP